MKKLNLGLIGILIIGVVMVSGCTGTGNKISSNYSIEEGNTPSVSILSDGSLMIGGLIQNTGNTNYKNVKISINGYNDNGTLVFTKNQTIAQLDAGANADYHIIQTWKGGNISYAKITVLNATPT